MRMERALRLSLVMGLVLAGLPAPVTRAQDGPLAPERGPRQIIDEDFLALQADLAQQRPAEAEPLEGIASVAGKLVYQSFRDGNWEIYYSSDEGAGVRRLTNDPALDIEPRLSPDATQVVFTSKRTGNFELYLINVDGSGLRQLTNQPGVDGSPAWSSDGRRIAFSSDRDGNPEIYVMNADGSELVRLTNAPGYDDEPAWSPDGRQIAFTSRRTGDEHSYYIWVMNADGTGVRQLSSHWYSGNPIWSPDGSTVFFDAANDRGWSRLMAIPASGGIGQQLLPSFLPATYAHFLVGTTSFRGGLYFTVALYIVNGNKLELQDLRLYSLANTGSTIIPMGPHFGSLNAFPDWRSADQQPPRSVLLTPSGPILPGLNDWPTVVAAAADIGSAGIGRVEVQYRLDGDGNWHMGNCGPSQQTPGQFNCSFYGGYNANGKTFFVRVRAVDAMDNEEPWPPGDGVRVMQYTLLVQGIIRDNRGLPVFGANIEANSALYPRVTSDPFGRFNLYMVSTTPENSYTVTARNLASTVNQVVVGLAGRRVEHHVYLPPSTNLVTNGTFEDGLRQWSVLPAGSASEAPPSQFSRTTGLMLTPLVITQSVTLTGRGEFGAQYSPDGFVAFDNQGGSLHLQECIARSGQCRSLLTSIQTLEGWAYGLDGTLNVIGKAPSTDERWFAQLTSSGRPSASTVVVATPTGSYSQLLYAPDGRLHWLRTDEAGGLYHFIRQLNGTWTAALVLASFETGSAVVGPGGNIALLGCRGSEALYVGWTSSQGWSAPELVSALPCTSALAGIDANGVVYGQWRGTGNLAQQFAVRGSAGGWRIAPAPTATMFQTETGTQYWLVASTRPAGTLSVVDVGDGQFNVRRLQSDGTWSDRVRLAANLPDFGSAPTVFVLDEERQGLLYTDKRLSPYSPTPTLVPAVNHWRFGPDTAVGSSVEQTISIPATMSAPTLSFYAGYGTAGERFRVAVRETDGDVTQVFAGHSEFYGLLNYHWVDLLAWRGQTVTLLFQMLAAGDNSTFDFYPIRVDDVWLSDWHTPLLETVSPLVIPPEGATLTITGQNLSTATEVSLGEYELPRLSEASPGVYTVTLSAGAPPGTWPLWASNPGSFMSAHAQYVRVGRLLYLPILSLWSRP